MKMFASYMDNNFGGKESAFSNLDNKRCKTKRDSYVPCKSSGLLFVYLIKY